MNSNPQAIVYYTASKCDILGFKVMKDMVWIIRPTEATTTTIEYTCLIEDNLAALGKTKVFFEKDNER